MGFSVSVDGCNATFARAAILLARFSCALAAFCVQKMAPCCTNDIRTVCHRKTKISTNTTVSMLQLPTYRGFDLLTMVERNGGVGVEHGASGKKTPTTWRSAKPYKPLQPPTVTVVFKMLSYSYLQKGSMKLTLQMCIVL